VLVIGSMHAPEHATVPDGHSEPALQVPALQEPGGALHVWPALPPVSPHPSVAPQ
jgi:hypothetical protein